MTMKMTVVTWSFKSEELSKTEPRIHVKVVTGGGGTHELDVAPSQTVAEVKKAIEQQMGAHAYQQQLLLVPAEGADSRDIHQEELPNTMTFSELHEQVGADRTLQLAMIVDPRRILEFDDKINATKFETGQYTITFEGTSVSAGRERSTEELRKLAKGTVNVVEIAKTRDRTRGRLESGGWISLLNPVTGQTWAQSTSARGGNIQITFSDDKLTATNKRPRPRLGNIYLNAVLAAGVTEASFQVRNVDKNGAATETDAYIGVVAENGAATAHPRQDGVAYYTTRGAIYTDYGWGDRAPPRGQEHALHLARRHMVGADGVVNVRVDGDQVHYTFYGDLDAFNSNSPGQSESVPLGNDLKDKKLRLVVQLLSTDEYCPRNPTATIVVQEPTASKEAESAGAAPAPRTMESLRLQEQESARLQGRLCAAEGCSAPVTKSFFTAAFCGAPGCQGVLCECQKTRYCSRECLRAHKAHKAECDSQAAKKAANEASPLLGKKDCRGE